MKKLLSLLLTVCLCLSLGVMFSSCGSSADFEYQLSDDGSYYIITKINITKDTEVIDIPAEHDGKPVKALTSLSNSESLIQVKNNHKSSIAEINIPNSVRFVDGISVDEGCVLNFGDYTDRLVPTSTFNFPDQCDYNTLVPYTFYEFSVILANVGGFDLGGNVTFPENVVFYNEKSISVNSLGFENLSFAGKISTYQKGNAENGWDDVITRLPSVYASKNAEIPEVAVGKGYSDIYIAVPTSTPRDGHAIESLIVSKSVSKITFNAANSSAVNGIKLYCEEGATPEGIYPKDMSNEEKEEKFLIYVYSETQPTDTSVKYWHYVDGVPTPW